MKNKNKKLATALLLALGLNALSPAISSFAASNEAKPLENNEEINTKNEELTKASEEVEKLQKEVEEAQKDLSKAE